MDPGRDEGPLTRLTRLGYSAYVWVLLGAIALVAWPLVALVPNPRRGWAVTRAAGRVLMALAGISFRVAGEPPTETGPYVVVANHASFIDGLVLVMSFATPVVLVAGGELSTQRLAGPYLRGIGCEFVRDRAAPTSTENPQRYEMRLRGGQSLAIFPEASLGEQAGLRRFHLGAFVLAVETGVPILPVGIRGSRGVVAPGSKLARRGAVCAVIGQLIHPAGTGREATLALRDETRAAIRELSGEPDLLT
jgi:1-acyl-sn-glycerol-3-phosphate acyltransferase